MRKVALTGEFKDGAVVDSTVKQVDKDNSEM